MNHASKLATAALLHVITVLRPAYWNQALKKWRIVFVQISTAQRFAVQLRHLWVEAAPLSVTFAPCAQTFASTARASAHSTITLTVRHVPKPVARVQKNAE